MAGLGEEEGKFIESEGKGREQRGKKGGITGGRKGRFTWGEVGHVDGKGRRGKRKMKYMKTKRKMP